MTHILILTPEAFQTLAQQLEGQRFVNTALADAGYVNLCLDAYGDWVVLPVHGAWLPGTVQTLDAVLSSTTSEPQRPSEQGVQVV